MRNLKLESTTDSEFAQRAAQTQPDNLMEVVITTAQPTIQRGDGSIEHADDDVQTLSARRSMRVSLTLTANCGNLGRR